MAERIRLEVPATLGASSIVRMVLGGVGARLDFSLEQLDDLFLASDTLLRTALELEEVDRLIVEMTVSEGELRVWVGDFCSAALKEQVGETPGGCIDVCMLLRRLLDGVAVEDQGTDGRYRVVMVKAADTGEQ